MTKYDASTADDSRGETWRAAREAFQSDHPRPVILLVMRFDDTPTMNRIRDAILRVGRRLGHDVVRADDRDYTGELWTNVELCLRACDLVIAVLEDIERRDCDANVMVELGYALGLARRCPLLVERRLPELPAVIRHRVTYKFDAYGLPESVELPVERWIEQDIRGRI